MMALTSVIKRRLEKQNGFAISASDNVFEKLKVSFSKKGKPKKRLGKGYVKFGESVCPASKDEKNRHILAGW